MSIALRQQGDEDDDQPFVRIRGEDLRKLRPAIERAYGLAEAYLDGCRRAEAELAAELGM